MKSKKTIGAAQVAGRNGFSLISSEKFRELYTNLLQCTMLDDRLRTEPCYERWWGREASAAGVTACLHSGDIVTPTPRGLLAYYLRTGSLRPSYKPATTNLVQLATATGDALRHKLEKQGNIAVVFTAADDPERMREIFLTAAGQSLPVLYVVEGEVYREEVFGSVPVIRVDGADTVAVYRVAHESIRRAREGGGPTIMECIASSGKNEQQDPLAKLEDYLTGKGLFRPRWKEQLKEKYSVEMDKAVAAARMN